jgi:hypothetical protein
VSAASAGASARTSSDWRKRRRRRKSRYCSRASGSSVATYAFAWSEIPATPIVCGSASARYRSPCRAACRAKRIEQHRVVGYGEIVVRELAVAVLRDCAEFGAERVIGFESRRASFGDQPSELARGVES